MGSVPPNAGPPPGGDFSQMSQGYPQGQQGFNQQQPLPPPAKKGKAWIWVLGGCFGLILIGAIGAMVVGYFVVQKTKEVAGDFEKRPIFTAAKALVMLNPEIELVEADENTERITIREKRTGKTMSVTLDQLQQGKITFTNDEGEEFTMKAEGEGDQGSISVESSDGTEVFNTQVSGESRFPDWVPVPPGNVKRNSKTTTNEITIYSAVLETEMGIQELADWLEREARAQGLRVAAKNVTTGTEGAALMFSATSEDSKRVLSAMGGSKAGTGTMEIIFSAQERP